MLKSSYKVLNEVRLNKEAFIHNHEYFASNNPQAKIAHVLKSNAYGHGLEPIAKLVDHLKDVPYICVDSLYEAYELQKYNTKTPILILGYTFPQNYRLWKKIPFTFSVSDTETLLELNKYQSGATIHLKIDTGMCRLGIQPNEVHTFIQVLKQCNNLVVEGIYSHLSQADDPAKKTFTKHQLSLFKTVIQTFESAGFNFKWKHLSASSGSEIIHDTDLNLIRLGIGSYGISPFGPHTAVGRKQRQMLRPVLSLISHIAQIKTVLPGNEIGYGGTYKVKHQSQIAILPIGYNEGINRHLSNHSQVRLEDGSQCPVVGNISMNMTTIKLPKNSQAKVGDEVIIISDKHDDEQSMYHHSQQLDTIPYTILTGLHASIRRRIV